MRIAGPFLHPQRKQSPKKWFLRYFVPDRNPDGSLRLNAEGRAIKKKCRPYYLSKEATQADKVRLEGQQSTTGAGAACILTRAQVEDFEAVRAIVSETSLFELAKFWRLRHPTVSTLTIAEHKPKFLDWINSRLGGTRHYEDLKSRFDLFCAAGFGIRLPATVTREEFLAYLRGLPAQGYESRCILNQKRGRELL